MRTGTTVTSVTPAPDGGHLVRTDQGDWSADAVVVASGACNLPHLPAPEAALPGVTSLTALGYRNPQQVRVPRRYRGADIMWWMDAAGVLGEGYREMDDLVRARSLPSMQLSGSSGDAALDLNALTPRGARLLGRLAAVRDGRLLFSGSLRNVCRLADLKLDRLLGTLDVWADETGVDVSDPPERLAPTAVPADPTLEIDLRKGEIRTIIWATGYRPDLSWLKVPVLNPRGRLIHDGGVARFPGLYFMGMPFLRRRKSTLIDGADADAGDLAAHLVEHLDAVVRRRGLLATT